MKLQEIFDHLSYGEFSQLSIGGQPVGEVNETNQNRIVSYVQLALTALYKRFNLKERRITFPISADSTTYALNVTDLLKIERVLTDDGYELGLNNEADIYAVSTPTMYSVLVPQVVLDQGADLPEELKTTELTVVYRANHPKLLTKYGVLFPVADAKDIELPESHLQALLYHVANRVQSPLGTQQEGAVSLQYMARYEQECQQLETSGMQINQGTQHYRATRNGWA